ncbi:MAG: NAD-binding protein [Haloarculaceae archaeon]
MAGDTSEPRPDSALDELFYRTDRVPMVYWRQFSGVKTTVALTGAVAVLAFVTGLSDLSQTVLRLDGPLGGLLPASATGVRLYGVFFAFLVGGLTLGLRRRKRVVWYVTLIALSLLAVLPLLTADATDVPLVILIAITLPLLVWNREQFDEPIELTGFQLATLAAFGGVQVYGIVGAYVMREKFVGIDSFLDALYYVVVTNSTVGYGDATPTTAVTKLFSLSIIVLGTASFTLATGSIVIPAIENRISSALGNMTAAELELLEDHVLVLGNGDLTEPLLEELGDDVDVVVVTADPDAASSLKDDGYSVLTAYPSDEEALRDARIEEASGAVVATHDDAQDVMAILAAKKLNPDVRVVAAATDDQHVDKLERVGADQVISPTLMGGRLLGRSVLGQSGPLTADGRVADDDRTDTVDDGDGRNAGGE